MANAVDKFEVPEGDDLEISEAEIKTIECELNELLTPTNGDDKEECCLSLSPQVLEEQPDVTQIIQSVAKITWTEAKGKFFGSGFLAKITLGVEDRLGFFTAGHNLYDTGTKQLVKFSSVQLRFKDIQKQTKKIALSKFLGQKHVLIVAYKTCKIISRNGQESTQPCQKGLDFGAVIFTAPVDSAARFLSRLGLSYLQVASRGACSSAPTKPVQLVGFPKYIENSPMRILPGNELEVPQGNIPDHCYDMETETGASGGSVLDKGGSVVAVHIRGQNIKKGDQGNWGLGFDIIREELQLCLNIPSLPSQAQPGTSDPHKTQGMPSVVRFLKNLKLDEHISAFEEHHIDMEVLEDCEPEELEQMLEKMEVSLGHSNKIKKALKHEKQEKKKQMKKEQEREEDQLENIGVNETAAASNVKMSRGVIIKIIGIVIAVIAVIAHYYPGYKGGVGSVSKWVLYNNSPGCGADFISTPAECMQAAQKLGFTGQMNPGRWSDKPPGCSAGTQGFIYFNQDVVGTTGITSLRSLCLFPGSAVIPEAFALTIPGCEEEDDVVYWGHDLGPNNTKDFPNGTVADCANWCGEVEECKFWTFEKTAKKCWLKDDKGTDRRIDHDRVSGSKECADPKIDCEFGPWGEFEACTASCGGGSMTRWRNISVEAQFGGQECHGSKNETRICNAEECPPPGDLIVSADEGEAAEYQGCRMGLYRPLDGSSYQQVGGGWYIYQVLPERHWYISDTLMKKAGGMKNPTESSSVPASGWKFYDGSEWRDDPLLSVRMSGQELQCNTITITSSRCTRQEVLGDFRRIKNDVLNGHPVFRNSFNQYLRVPTGGTAWGVSPQRDGGDAWLNSGRATSCPAHPNTGLTRRLNRKHWQYWDGEKWVEDPTLFVTCNE